MDKFSFPIYKIFFLDIFNLRNNCYILAKQRNITSFERRERFCKKKKTAKCKIHPRNETLLKYKFHENKRKGHVMRWIVDLNEQKLEELWSR